jgi:glycosyltransferase involved in cell wall biosynthesis
MSPRVLIMLENEPYPYDRRVQKEATTLRDAGYEVTVLCPTGDRERQIATVIDGVRVLRFPAPPGGAGAFGYAREYGLALVRTRAIIRRLRHEPPFDVVIACNPPDFLLHLARPLRRAGAALIFDYHDPAPELFEAMFERRGPLHRLLLWLERRAFRAADLVMTVNDPCAELVRRRGGVPADRVRVVMNAPDPERFHRIEPVPELRRGREHLVLWIGRMSRKEGLDLLLDAAEELTVRGGRTDVAFAIVGRGDIRDQLQADIERRGLADVVALPGEADDEQLRRWMSTASICLSLDRRDELNDRSVMVKVLEYMAMGCAVVQFPLAEMQRVCGDATRYARDGDALDLAAAVGELLDDPDERARYGRRAEERIRDGLTWPGQAPALLAAVEDARTLRGRRPDR